MIKEQIRTQNSLADLKNLSRSNLSIQISLDGFSYCVFDNDLVDVVLLKHFNFSERAKNPTFLLKNVQQVFLQEPFLYEKFQSVNVSYQNNLYALVPDIYYDETALSDYLKYDVRVFNKDDIRVDHISDIHTKNVFIPFNIVSNYLTEVYDNFEIVHSSTVLINSLLKYFQKSQGEYFFVNIAKHSLDIIFLSEGKLQFFNTFTYVTKEDLIYYILFVMEQLDLDPNNQALTLIGTIDKESPFYEICYKYIRNVNFLNINNFSLSEDFYEQNPHILKHHFFTLLNQF